MFGKKTAGHRSRIVFCALVGLILSVLLAFAAWSPGLLEAAYADGANGELSSLNEVEKSIGEIGTLGTTSNARISPYNGEEPAIVEHWIGWQDWGGK